MTNSDRHEVIRALGGEAAACSTCGRIFREKCESHAYKVYAFRVYKGSIRKEWHQVVAHLCSRKCALTVAQDINGVALQALNDDSPPRWKVIGDNRKLIFSRP